MRLQRRPALVTVVVAIMLAVGTGAGLADYESGSTSSSSYMVHSGDTLWGIALAHHLTVTQLASYNGIDPDAILPIGRKLAFPASSSGASSGSSGSPGSSGSSGFSSGFSGRTLAPAAFCSSLSVAGGPRGVLPAQLQASPSRLALRPLIQHWANYYGLSAPLLEALTWQESGWQQGVVSSVGAVGVGQLMPGTASFIQTGLVAQPLDIWSVSDNIRMAAAFLAYLAHIEGNNRCYTIAAYYEGPVNLTSAGVFPDTQLYVADVEALEPGFS